MRWRAGAPPRTPLGELTTLPRPPSRPTPLGAFGASILDTRRQCKILATCLCPPHFLMAGDAPDPTPTHNFHHGPESTPMNIGSALESLLRGETMSLTWRVSVRNTFVYNTKIASRIVGKKSNVIVGESFHKVTHTGRCIVLFAIAKLRQLYSNVSVSYTHLTLPTNREV